MQVADVMTREVITTTESASLAQAVELMLEHRISGLPVIGTGGRLSGMLSEGDLLRRTETGTAPQVSGWRALLAGPERLARWYLHTHGRKVGEVMTQPVVSVSPATPLTQAVELMQRHRIKRLPVLTEDGQLAGIISRADVLRALDRLLREHAEAGSDDAIRARIQAELADQRWLPPAQVNVTVQQGTVNLRGVVFGNFEREALRVLVENIPGVRKVIDQLVWIEPYTGTVVALTDDARTGS
jgi:CBS domain-containing protein